MSNMFVEIFAWWTGNTWGTRLWTRRHGEKVGTDEAGNTYYQTRGGKVDPALGYVRRWVIYAGHAEASKIPPGWHGWLHYRVDTPPSRESYVPRDWQVPHRENPTGSPAAYRPKGSIVGAARRAPATGDYQPWSPVD